MTSFRALLLFYPRVTVSFTRHPQTREYPICLQIRFPSLGQIKYPSDILHNTIERIGGVFSVQTSYEETQIIVEVIEKHADLAFDIVRDIVLNPNLDAKYIEKARSLLLEDVRRKRDDPATLAFDKAKEIIFNGNGYGAYPTEKSLNSITAD